MFFKEFSSPLKRPQIKPECVHFNGKFFQFSQAFGIKAQTYPSGAAYCARLCGQTHTIHENVIVWERVR
jgi:hypothetical protein